MGFGWSEKVSPPARAPRIGRVHVAPVLQHQRIAIGLQMAAAVIHRPRRALSLVHLDRQPGVSDGGGVKPPANSAVSEAVGQQRSRRCARPTGITSVSAATIDAVL